MVNNLEKSLKRWLKKKVKITLGTIVAFLLSCNFISAESLEVTRGDNGEILFNGKIFDEENHQFIGNTFDGNTYLNTNILKIEAENNKGNTVYIDVNTNDFTFINNGVIDSYTKYTKQDKSSLGYGIYIQNQIKKIENNGNIISKIENNYFQNGENNGIFISGNSEEIKNNGILQSEFLGENTAWMTSNNGITVFSDVKNIINNGLILSVLNEYKKNVTSAGISIALELDENNSFSKCGKVDKISNTGIIHTKGNETGTIWNNGKVNLLENKGNISSYCDMEENNYTSAISSSPYYEDFIPINNDGRILSINLKGYSEALSGKIGTIENNGLIYSKGKISEAISFSTNQAEIKGNLKNFGAVINIQKENDKGIGLSFDKTPIENSVNYGIISADIPVKENYVEKITNYGLFMNEKGKILSYDKNSKKFITQESDKNKAETSIEYQDIGKTIINAGSNSEGIAQSIKSDTIKDLSEEQGYILNGYNETVVLNSTTGSKNINNSIINAVKNAVTFDGENLTLGLNNTVVNGGYGEDIILGDSNKNSLNISGESIINGNINLGEGNDKLSLDNTVQINGILDGGEGVEDTLAFNSSTTKSEDKNINILYDIKGFEKTDIDTNVTLFEKTVDDNGDVKNLSAQLGDITIEENGNLNLRVDGTEKTDGKVTGHALYGNKGSITTEDGGKLTLNTIGFGEEEIIAFNQTDITGLKAEDIIVSSYLHEGEINSDNTITVSAKKDLEDIELDNYEKLNAIYHSLIAENLDKFTVEEEQYGAFTKYLHDIYAGNPYTYSSELSRKTMGMMRDIADKDLNPDLKEWAIFGGLTHIDGGTENSYYGKGYYSYDIGSRDISADTKITGAYVKGEYGKAEDLTLGVILGGNSSETEVENSKVEGDSFYLGGYAKKYLNNFRFTLGAGIHRGDYEADRVAVGYDGITETRKFSENYGDRGFNLYGNVKYSQELGNGFYFEPSVTLDYSYVDQEGVKESGDLAIDVDSEKFDYTSGIVNLDIRKEFVGEKAKHSLIAGVSYERILSGEDEKHITGRFKGGTDFDILVPEKEKDNFALNVKYEVETEKGILFDVKGSYKFEHDSNKDQWIVGTGIGYKF